MSLTQLFCDLGNPSIYPLKVDVTKESDVDDASIAVMKWLKDPVFTKPRCLHAVINNAGVGTGGLIDWNPLSNYKFVMNGKFALVLSILPDYASLSSEPYFQTKSF